MKYLLLNTKILIIILFFLTLLPSCNNEDLFIDENYLIEKERVEAEVAAEAAADAAERAAAAAETAAAAAETAAAAAETSVAKEEEVEATAASEKAKAAAEVAAAAAEVAAEAAEAAAEAAKKAATEEAEAAKKAATEEAEAAAEEAEAAAEKAEAAANQSNEDVDDSIDLFDDNIRTIENIPLKINSYLNDNNLPLTFELSYTNPSNGVLSINNNETPNNLLDDTLLYAPNAGFSGIDSFNYTICDVTNSENCDTAIVRITIEPRENDFATELKAFPSAQGGGSEITGGRGGTVIHVTNLNNSGPGSFREALLTTGRRIIVFDVSGVINLSGRFPELTLAHSNFTVAGQTAPEGGITITGKPIQLGGGYSQSQQPCNNAIFRYIRFRNGSYTGVSDVYTHNGLISTGTDGLMVDHCSFSFNDDQAISMNSDYGDLTNMTIQNCLFSENATGIVIGINGNYDKGNMTIKDNLFVHQTHRTPNIAGNLQYDIINNVMFNYKSRLVNVNGGTPDVNFIGNYMYKGSYSTDDSPNKVQNITPSIYTANNYHNALRTTPILDDQIVWAGFSDNVPLASSFFRQTQHTLLPNTSVTTAREAYNIIIVDVGTNKSINADGSITTFIDSYDSERINDLITKTSRNPYNKSWTQPTIPQNRRSDSYDKDNDGMPDAWETLTFGDLTKTGKADTDGDGYTDLEEFLNLVDK